MTEDAPTLRERRQVYDSIVAAPGISAREIQRAVGLGWGETTAHLLRLEEAGHVERLRGTHQDFFVVRAMPSGSRGEQALAASPAAGQLLVALLEDGELPLDVLARRIGRSEARTSWELRRLVALGALSSTIREGRPVFAIRDRGVAGRILLRRPRGAVEGAIDTYADSWAELLPP